MADAFPPSEPELAELSTCSDEADTDPEEDMEDEEEMEDEEDFTVEVGTTYSCRRADGTYLDAEVVKMRTNKRAKREEYMVRYVGLTRRQTEWVDKSRLVLLKPQEDEDAEEGSDQEMSETEQTLQDQNQKPDEDEPEPKKVKVESNETAAKSVLMAPGDFAEELTCLLCGKLYEEPVMVECGHDFCRRCVEKVWADEEFFTCPDCKEVMTEKSYSRNRALANLLKKATAVAPIIPFKNCDDHQEQVKLYCKDDGTLCCIICQDSLKHVDHSLLPIVEAVELYRTQLSGLINPLEEALTKTEELAVQYSEGIGQHQSKMIDYRQKVASEFEMLYCSLKERKEALLQQLQKQGKSVLKKMEANADKISKNRENLKEAIVGAAEKVDDTDCYSFLADVKPLFKKLKEQKKAALSCRDTLADKELSHGQFNGPIQYIFWRQLKSLIGPVPEFDEEVMSEAPEKAVEPEVEPTGLTDAAMETDKQPKPEESDEEEAAQVPEIPVEDFSDLKVKEPKEIWIVGDGYIGAVGRVVAKGPYADNLLFPKSVCNIRWLSNIKACGGLLSKLKREVETQRKPNIIFLHIGSYALGHRSFDALNTSFLNDLDSIIRLFPRVVIILSTVLPRKEWMTSPVERNRKSFNNTLRRYAGRNRFQVVKHGDLENVLVSRLEGGGDSNLNDSECEMFFKTMREALIKELRGRMRCNERAEEKEKSITYSGSSLTSGKNTESLRKAESSQSPAERERELMKRLLTCSREPQAIWIVGNIYIFKAFGHVGKRPYGPHLRLKEYNWHLRWLGRTSRWQNILIDLQNSVGLQGMPSAIFLHVGSDDLEIISYEALVNDMRNCLGQLTVTFPKVKLILSAVLPKAEWLGTHLEECRKMFNTRLYRYAERYGFQMATHTNLEQRLSLRFRRDRNSNLKLEENDLFVSDIRDSLLKTLMKDLHSTSENPDTQEKKSVSSKDARPEKKVDEGVSTKAMQPSAEKKERTRSSAEQQSEADVSITESEQQEMSIEGEEELQESVLSSDKKLILIIGDVVVFKACNHAGNTAYGMNLGFEEDKWNVRWIGRVMKWSRLVPSLKKYHGSNTSAIFIYLGAKEVSNRAFSNCFSVVRYNTNRLAKMFPKAQIILSSLLPKAEWMDAKLEHMRERYNKELPAYATKQGFECVSHEELEKKLIARINGGDRGSIFSDECIEDFIKNIKDSLLKATEKGDRIPVEIAPQKNDDGEPDIYELENTESDQLEFEEPPIDPENLPEHKIWIIGNSLIREVHMHALNSSWGQNLGLEKRNWTLHWWGKVKQWPELLMKMRETSNILGVPSAVFLHLGSDDLGHCRISKLLGDFRSCMGQVISNFPKTQFIFSPIVPRAEWVDKPLGGCRRKYNFNLSEYARKRGYVFSSQVKLDRMRLARFKSGNQSGALSPDEMELFIKALKISLLKALLTDHMGAGQASFIPRMRREPQEVVLPNGATFYFVPDAAERRPLKVYDDEKRPRRTLITRAKMRSSERSESDQSDSDRSSSDEDDSDEDKSDREDRGKADPEEADKERSTEERSSSIREEAEQDKEKKGADEGRAAVQEKAEQDVEMMECDPKATLPKNEGAPGQPEHPVVVSSTEAPVEEKSGPKQVWVIGCSFLCRAKQHAHSKPYWNNLGFNEKNLTIHWMGCIGMRWESLAEEVDKAQDNLGMPSIIVIHLGGNDMGRMPYKDFFKAVKYDFRRFDRHFSKTQVIFSTILPRAEWLMTPVEQVRMKFNESIVKYSWSLGFHVLVHNNIEEKAKARFKSGRGSDLSDMEYHLFLTSIRDSVQKVLAA